MNSKDYENTYNSSDTDQMNFPDDLAYSNDKWESALGMIEAHDRKVRNRKFFAFGFLIFMGIASTLFIMNKNSDGKHIDQHTSDMQIMDRNEEQIIENNSKIKDSKSLESTPSIIEETNTADAPTKIAIVKNPKPDQTEQYAHLNQNRNKTDNGNIHDDITVDDSNISMTKEIITADAIKKKEQLSPNATNEEKITEIQREKSPYSSGEANGYDAEEEDEFELTKLRTPPFVEVQTVKSVYSKLPSTDQLDNYKIIDQERRIHSPFRALTFTLGAIPYSNYGKEELWSNFNPSVGLNYEDNISENLGWYAGVGYFSITDIPLVLESTQSTLGYGIESVVTSVETEKIHFLTIPAGLTINVTKRAKAMIGSGISYLITAENQLSINKVQDGQSEFLSSEKTSGYIQGFNRINPFGTVGLDYWLTRKLAFGTMYQSGLNDFSKNEEFGAVTDDPNSKIIVSLKILLR